MLYFKFLIFILPVHFGMCTNILAVLPSVWKSHYIFGRRVLEQLLQQNNTISVTIISPYSHNIHENQTLNDKYETVFFEEPTPKIREIKIQGLMEMASEMGLSVDLEEMRAKSIMERFTRLIYAGTANVDLLLSDSQVRKLLRSGEKFDLLVVDLFLSDALLGLAFYYQIPTVVLSPQGSNGWLNEMMGNPQSYALDPSNFLPFSERMNFWQRSLNTLMGLFEKLTYNFFHTISQQSVYIKHFQALCHLANLSLPHHRDLTQNISLLLINSNAVLSYPRAYLPNIIQVGGLHLKTEGQLPQHLKEFVESGSEGTIYMSLGANIRSVDISKDKLDDLMDAFSYLKNFNFLLKWEMENEDGFHGELPTNVMINSWFPQTLLLAHPNIKVFISSCGVMSIIEAINGVTPILAIPLFPEQEAAAHRLETQGVSWTLPYDELSYDSVLYGIKKLTSNGSYIENMNALKSMWNYEFGSPVAKVTHYVELVLNSSAQFLKSHARNHLNYFRAELFDVSAIIVLGLSLIVAIPFSVTCCILRKSYQREKQAQQYRIIMKGAPVLKRSRSFAGEYSTTFDQNLQRSLSLSLSTNASCSSSSLSSTNVINYDEHVQNLKCT